MKTWHLRAVLLLLLGPAAAAAACPLAQATPRTMTLGSVQAVWQALPQTIAVGQPFALLVTLCPAQAQLLRVDATMPEHRHGMNYRASVTALSDGRWRVEGLLWHMSGRWELTLDVLDQGVEYRLRQSVELP